MTTSSQTEAAPIIEGSWSHPKAQAILDGYGSEKLTVTRAASGRGDEHVFIQVNDEIVLWLTPQQAADFAEAVHDVSGMATSTYDARFLAEVVREAIAGKGVTQKRVLAQVGCSRYRLRRILSGKVPMTHAEHVALSEVWA